MERPVWIGVITGLAASLIAALWFAFGLPRTAVVVAIGLTIGAMTTLIVGALEVRRASRRPSQHWKKRTAPRGGQRHPQD